METDRRIEATLIRVRSERVVPLEIWDWICGGRRLFETMAEPDFPSVLARAIGEIRDGIGRSWLDRPLPHRTSAVKSVVFAGGGARREGLVEAAEREGFEARCVEDPEYAFEAGAGSLLGSTPSEALVVDVGQTALKIAFAGRRTRIPRDFSRLPIQHELAPDALVSGRQDFIGFVAGAIRETLRSTAPVLPSTFVLALPAAIDDDHTVHGCTYPYAAPDLELPADLRRASGLERVETLLLNDSELVAHGVASDPAMQRRHPVLVVTLGFGPGSALVLPRT